MEAQGKLFELEPIRIQRPSFSNMLKVDEKSIYRNIAQDIINWDSELNDECLAEVIESLECYFSVSEFVNNSGYELCRDLEDEMGYSPDDELVEVMAYARMHVNNAIKEAVKEWVVDCWIKPKFKVGDKMEIEYNGSMHEAEITEIDEKYARYLFFIPDMMAKRTGGTYKNFESVEPDFFKKPNE